MRERLRDHPGDRPLRQREPEPIGDRLQLLQGRVRTLDECVLRTNVVARMKARYGDSQ
jgi:hypothetical protein